MIHQECSDYSSNVLGSGALGDLYRKPVSKLWRQRENFVLRPSQHYAVKLNCEFRKIRGSVRDPAKTIVRGRAVPFREAQKTASQRVIDDL